MQAIARREQESAIFMIFVRKMRALLVKRTRRSNTYNKDGTHTLPIRCECSINSISSAIPFPLCRHMSRSLDGLCCMKPTTESEVLVLLVFLATVPASLATDRTTTSTRYVDRATPHESNSDLSNQLRRIRSLKEGEKIKRFMYLLMSEILLCVIILVQLLHVALIHQPKFTFSENPAEAPQTTFFLLFGGNIFRAKRKKFSSEEEEIWHKSLATGCYFIKNGRISKKSGPQMLQLAFFV